MALILVMAKEHWMDKLSDNEKNKKLADKPNLAARIKRGDVSEVREDDAPFGRKECLPNFLVVKAQGPASDYMYLMEAETEKNLVYDPVINEHRLEETLLQMRKYTFDIDKEVGAERLKQIEEAKEWLVDDVDVSKVKMKASRKIMK